MDEGKKGTLVRYWTNGDRGQRRNRHAARSEPKVTNQEIPTIPDVHIV